MSGTSFSQTLGPPPFRISVHSDSNPLSQNRVCLIKINYSCSETLIKTKKHVSINEMLKIKLLKVEKGCRTRPQESLLTEMFHKSLDGS